MDLKTAVMAFKVKGDKENIKALAFQTCQITTRCVQHNIKIIDAVIVFGGTKDILREVKKLDKRERFDYLIIYAPRQITQTEQEYNDFVATMQQEYQVEVLPYRQG